MYLLLASTCLALQPNPFPHIPVHLFPESVYAIQSSTFVNRSGETASFVVRQKISGLLYRFQVSEMRDIDHENVYMLSPALNPPDISHLFSGMPLGRKVRFTKGVGPYVIRGTVNKVAVQAVLSGKVEKVNGNTIHQSGFSPSECELLESAARWVIGHFAGRNLQPSGTFEGLSQKKAPSGTQYIPLKGWGQSASYNLAFGSEKVTAQLTKSGKPTLIFAAGANAFKKGSQWIALPDTTMMVNGELWVPTSVLDHI